MGAFVDYAVYGPPFSVVLSPVDQVVPPVYSRRILIFSRRDHNRHLAILSLVTRVQETVNRFPLLAGQMGFSPSGWTVKKGHARLRAQDVDMSFIELQSEGFPEKMLPANLLSSVPTFADPENEWHACRIQANFIRGGLLLVISIHHTIMDGYGITKAIEALARNCHVRVSAPSSQPISIDRSALFQCDGVTDIKRLSAYSIVRNPRNLGPIATNIVTSTFRLSESALKDLKAAASPATGWITTHDAVNALCWRNHARARYRARMLSDKDSARFAFPVEFRRLTRPPLSPEYAGNAVLMTQVELPIMTLLGPSGLSMAAAAIRTGVREVDVAYVDNFVSVAKSLVSPGQLKINLKLEEPRTGFGSTSYRSFEHSSLDWGPILDRFERLRLASGVTGEGMSIILPVLSDGSWEVTATVERELEEAFRTDEEWTRYIS